MASLNILVLTAYPPALGVHGGAMRMYYNLQILAAKHRVSLISFVEHERERNLLRQLEVLGIEVTSVLRSPVPSRNLWMPKPLEHNEFASPEMAAQVRSILENQSFDVIQVEYLQMAQHVPRSASQLKILTLHEIGYANELKILKQDRRFWAKAVKLYNWMIQLNYEVRFCRGFDSIVCMTDEDALILAEFVPTSKLHTIHIGVDSDFFDAGLKTGAAWAQKRMLFVGNYRHKPNRESVYYFVRDVLPQIHQRVPEAEFWVVGANADMLDTNILHANPKVRVEGYVEDIRPIYQDCAVFVAPIFSGNGMRVKLLEAFSMGMAVVASSLGAQGFCTQGGEQLLIADSTESFVSNTIQLLQNKNLCVDLGSKARKLIREHYDWSVIGEQFLDLVEDCHG